MLDNKGTLITERALYTQSGDYDFTAEPNHENFYLQRGKANQYYYKVAPRMDPRAQGCRGEGEGDRYSRPTSAARLGYSWLCACTCTRHSVRARVGHQFWPQAELYAPAILFTVWRSPRPGAGLRSRLVRAGEELAYLAAAEQMMAFALDCHPDVTSTMLCAPASHGWWSHIDAPYYIPFVFIHKNYNGGRLNDSTAYG